MRALPLVASLAVLLAACGSQPPAPEQNPSGVEDRTPKDLTVTKPVAKKLKLKSTTLAGGSLRCGAEGRAALTLKPSAKVKAALAKAKGSITATLTLRLSGAAGAARDTQTVTLEGKS